MVITLWRQTFVCLLPAPSLHQRAAKTSKKRSRTLKHCSKETPTFFSFLHLSHASRKEKKKKEKRCLCPQTCTKCRKKNIVENKQTNKWVSGGRCSVVLTFLKDDSEEGHPEVPGLHRVPSTSSMLSKHYTTGPRDRSEDDTHVRGAVIWMGEQQGWTMCPRSWWGHWQSQGQCREVPAPRAGRKHLHYKIGQAFLRIIITTSWHVLGKSKQAPYSLAAGVYSPFLSLLLPHCSPGFGLCSAWWGEGSMGLCSGLPKAGISFWPMSCSWWNKPRGSFLKFFFFYVFSHWSLCYLLL